MKKIKILLIGYSDLAQRRILPAIKKCPQIELAGIASKSKFDQIPKNTHSFNDYKKAILKSGCDTVYVSLHNNAHFEWIKYAILSGKHVICDKPIFLSYREASECISLSKNKLLIFEAIPYLLHKQHQAVKRLISKQSFPVTKITALLGMPPLKNSNFRSDSNLGGGCIFDQGPYLISAALYYFDSLPKTIYCLSNNKKMPLSASVIMDFAKGKTLLSHFGFAFEYQNFLSLWGKGFYFSLNRAFAIPPDFNAKVTLKIKDKLEIKEIGVDDVFLKMFKDFMSILKKREFKNYHKTLVERTKVLEMMNISSKTGDIKFF